MKLILASQSPRRAEILRNAGIAFEVRASGVPEQPEAGESPLEYVRRLAAAKAAAVPRSGAETVLGADTVVVLDQHILEKPRDAADAERMLRMLSGREHTVITGVSLIGPQRSSSASAETKVQFVDLIAEDIEDYVRSGEPMDKAGAYAIQGLASKFITRIDGCYFNVVGLPISLVWRMLNGTDSVG